METERGLTMTMHKTLFLTLTLLLAACAMNFATMREASRPQVKLGMEKLAKNDLQGALLDLKKAEESNPYDPEVYYGLALTYRQWEKPALALSNIDKAITYGDKLGYEHPGMKSEAYNLKGDILAGQKRYDEALENFQQALKDDLYPTPEYTLYNMAVVYLAMNKPDEAQARLDAALAKNPHYAPAWFARGQLAMQKGDAVAAVNALKHAVQEFPDYLEAHWALAQLYLQSADKQAAIPHLKAVARLDKEGPIGKQAQRTLNDMGVYGDQ